MVNKNEISDPDKLMQVMQIKMMEQAMNRKSLRILATFGQSTYDITVTKPEEMDMVRQLLMRFEQSFNTPNNFF